MKRQIKKSDPKINESIIEAIQKFTGKYLDLVWYARSGCDKTVPADIAAGCFLSQCKVEQEYPTEVAEIADPDTGDWTHGFNSGVLATLRYVLTSMQDGIDAANDEWPMLDT